jgi:alkanesulfonate monooxygenase SsuD/methylene tetrahydromethanopterin reductase-like flavin-dependent oxidoreductase (luciferase family)
MLRIAVELPARLTTTGELLADVQAYEAAGAEAVWAGPGDLDPLTMLAAAAAVTARVRLVASVSAVGEQPAAVLAKTVTTLERLSRGGIGLYLDDVRDAEALVGALRAAGAQPAILVAGAGEDALRCAARLGDGLVCGPEEAPAAFADVRELLEPAAAANGAAAKAAESVDSGSAEQNGAGAFGLWVRAPAPANRAAWRELVAAAEAAGATGLVVGHAPNLLDMLRNPEEDDRQDLAMSVGWARREADIQL